MLDTTEVDFDAERERLRERMDEVADSQHEWEEAAVGAESERQESHARQMAEEYLVTGNDLHNQYAILETVAEEWDRDSVTLKGLTKGDINRISDTVDEIDTVTEQDAWVALGSVDAPYVEHDPGEVTQSAFETTVLQVTQLPLPYVKWAEARISELSHLGHDEGNSYFELVAEKRRETSQAGNG